MNFNIGSKAVYPAQGVIEVLGVEAKVIMGAEHEFFVLRVLDSDKKILIPIGKVDTVGLREVMDETNADEVYKILRTRTKRSCTGNWNRRNRAYNEKINTGSAFQVAEVLRDLNQLKYTKNLSFGERKMLDTARRLLVQELSVAQRVPEQDVETRIDRCFLN